MGYNEARAPAYECLANMVAHGDRCSRVNIASLRWPIRIFEAETLRILPSTWQSQLETEMGRAERRVSDIRVVYTSLTYHEQECNPESPRCKVKKHSCGESQSRSNLLRAQTSRRLDISRGSTRVAVCGHRD